MAGFSGVVLLMGAVSLISYQNAVQLVKSAQQVRQTNELLDTLTDISTTFAQAESSQWRYLSFNDQQALAQHQAAVESFDSLFAKLRPPLTDTPVQQQRLDRLESLTTKQISLFQQLIDLYRNEPTAITAASPIVQQIQKNLVQIRQLITQLEAKEEELLSTQVDQAQANLQIRMLIEPVATVLTFGFLSGLFVLLYRQMLQRQRAEALQRTLAQEKELSELKLQLFSMVSHEFRTPLSLILGSSQLLSESLKQQVEPAKLKNLYRIQSSARMMAQLLSDILTLARADAGKLEYRPEWIEIQTFCLNLVEDFQLFSESKQTLQFTQHCSSVHAYVDEKLLYSILSNLLSNAIKYSPPDSTVYFTLIRESNALTFQVRDQGIGIPWEDRMQLYEPFSRGSNTQETIGTGLGLAVVKKCLDLHQGEITVDSTVGVGTTFTICIPQPAGAKP